MSIIKPFTFVAGTKARADEVNRDFDVLYSQVNSNISSISDLNTDVENLDQDKADKEGSASQTFKVANPVNNYDAVNKQTMNNKLTPLFSYIDGLIITKDNNDSKTIIVSAGSCYDSTKEVVLSLSLPLSKQNATQSANSTYYVYIIGDNSGATTNIIISVDAVTPTLPTGYTKFRQIGYYVTDGNSNIVVIQRSGDYSLSIRQVTNDIMPDYSRLFTVGNNYTSTVNGWLIWTVNSGNSIHYNMWVRVNGVTVGAGNNGRSDGSSLDSGIVPIKVGDIVTHAGTGTFNLLVCPCVGWR